MAAVIIARNGHGRLRSILYGCGIIEEETLHLKKTIDSRKQAAYHLRNTFVRSMTAAVRTVIKKAHT